MGWRNQDPSGVGFGEDGPCPGNPDRVERPCGSLYLSGPSMHGWSVDGLPLPRSPLFVRDDRVSRPLWTRGADRFRGSQRRSPIAQSADPVPDWSSPERILGSDRTPFEGRFPDRALPFEPDDVPGSKGFSFGFEIRLGGSPRRPGRELGLRSCRRARTSRLLTSPWLPPLLPGACTRPRPNPVDANQDRKEWEREANPSVGRPRWMDACTKEE